MGFKPTPKLGPETTKTKICVAPRGCPLCY